MNVNIIKTTHDEALADYIDKHVRLAVDQFKNRVASLDVRVVDVHAGDEQQCTIHAHLTPRGQVHVEASSDGVHAAVAKASRRLSAAVAKYVDRGHRAHSIRHRQETHMDASAPEASS